MCEQPCVSLYKGLMWAKRVLNSNQLRKGDKGAVPPHRHPNPPPTHPPPAFALLSATAADGALCVCVRLFQRLAKAGNRTRAVACHSVAI